MNVIDIAVNRDLSPRALIAVLVFTPTRYLLLRFGPAGRCLWISASTGSIRAGWHTPAPFGATASHQLFDLRWSS